MIFQALGWKKSSHCIHSLCFISEEAIFCRFSYHLIKLKVFGISPDEAIYYRATLLRENTTNCLVMI